MPKHPHKCYFHPNSTIVSFCTKKQCTLPMCRECEPIHLRENQECRLHVLDIDRAEQLAVCNMKNLISMCDVQENRLDCCEILKSEVYARMEEGLVKMIEKYLTSLKNQTPSLRNLSNSKINELKKQMSKIEKGSLKSLIYYYSDELLETTQQIKTAQAFVTKEWCQQLSNKIMKLFQKQLNSRYENLMNAVTNNYLNIPYENIEKTINKRQQNNKSEKNSNEIEMIKATHSIYKSQNNTQHKPNPTNKQNVYQLDLRSGKERNKLMKIQEESNPNYDEYQYEKGLHEDSWKNGKNEKYGGSNLRDISVGRSYGDKSVEKVRNVVIKTSVPNANVLNNTHELCHNLKGKKTDHGIQRNRSQAALASNSKQLMRESDGKEENPITFEKRYDHPIDRKSHNPQWMQESKQYQPLKVSDLEIESHNSTHNLNRVASSQQILSHPNRAIRSITENHEITNKMRTTTQYNPDSSPNPMNRQILAPQQIRMMLEKRIEQRSKLMASRKSHNNNGFNLNDPHRLYTQNTQQYKYGTINTENNNTTSYRTDAPWNQLHQEQESEQPWNTKDSIINQIYHDSQY